MNAPSGPADHSRDHGSVHSSLPAVYAQDPTAQAFATAIDAMLIPVDRTLERLPDNFGAFEAPVELLPYLVRVSQARVEPSWPERAVRAAIDLAAWLAVHRGTPAALLREASVVYGWTLTVADPGGVHLPSDALTWPADGTLYVDLEPEQSGWDPVSYNQGSLERLINAHVPASSPRILAPPPGKCALYEGPYSTGRALLVSKDVSDLATSGFDNTASSVWNRSKGILALYEETDFGESGSRQIVPAQQAVNLIESMNKRTSSVKFLTTVPTGSWGLLDADGNLLGVYDGDMSDLETGVGAVAAALVNNTIHTIVASGTQPDASQVIYPGITAALDPGLAGELSRVLVYSQVPDDTFCLYEFAKQGGKQWILWTRPGESVGLAAIGADNVVSSVYNRTTVTLELWANSDGTGASQFFYPGAFANIAAPGLTGQASLVTVLDGAPVGYYCLYGGQAKTGKQWVFKELDGVTINLTDPDVVAGDAVSSVENLTSGTLELFRNDNGSGASQLFYPGLVLNVTTADLVGLARSVAAYSGPPVNYYCLYENADKTGNRWVFPGTVATVQLTSATIGAGNVASLVENNLTRTLALFKNDNGTGDSQFFYPGLTSAVTVSGLDKKAQSATVYDGPPNDHYCLYGGSPLKQWLFKAATNTDNALTTSGADSTVTQVQNKTTYTIELFAETNGTGAYQLFYPQTNRTVSVRSDFQNRAKLARCYNGPPADYFCLYDGTNQTGSQWVFRAAPGTWWDATLADQNWNDKISSVWNRTRHTLQLFEATGQGMRGELFYPGQNAKANVNTINNLASSVACYDGCPNGYYCLYEGTNQAGNQYVLRPTIGNADLRNIGANDMISSVRNLTNRTIQLWADPGPSGVWQLCYPSQNANVQSNLNDKTTIVTVHDGAPADYYCLYEGGPGDSYRQWLFHESASGVNLTSPGIGAVGISNVRNNTRYTLELWSEANATGQSQLFYPGLTTAAESSFNDKAKYASLHTYWHDRYFYLCEFPSYGGLQWAFKEGTKARLTDINAANRVSSIGNATWKPLTLYSNDNWTGTTYWLPRGGGGALVAPSLPGNIDNLSKSVWNTD